MLNIQTITQAAHLPNINTSIPLDTPAFGVAFHSQRVRQGDAFFALPGANGHGIAYADSALAAGAAFIVSDMLHPQGIQVPNPTELLVELGKEARAKLKGPVIGVTGSAGKTSTKAMLAATLRAEVSPGNFNTPLALAKVLIDVWLAGKTSDKDILVLELGIDHINEMDSLLALAQPTQGFLTLIAESHIYGLKDIHTVAREKGKIIEAARCSWVSADAMPYLKKKLHQKICSYGLKGQDADVCGEIVSSSESGQIVSVLGKEVYLPYVGKAMAKNAVGALGFAVNMGVNIEEAALHLQNLELEPRRLQTHKLKDFYIVDDCYNSNPASVKAALEALESFPKPHTVVLGDMLELGKASEELHKEIGQLTLEIDNVITCGEEARHIAAENPKARHNYGLEEAWLRLEKILASELKGTVLIKASRGMHFEQLVERALAYLEVKD